MKPITRGITILVVIIAVLIIVPVVLVSMVPKDRVRQIVVSRLEAQMHRPVQIRRADWHFLPHFRLRLDGIEVGRPLVQTAPQGAPGAAPGTTGGGVSRRAAAIPVPVEPGAPPPQPYIAAASVQLGLRLLPLLRQQVVITGVEIDRPVIENVLSAQPPAAAPAPSAPPSRALNLQVQNLTIRDGRITILLPDRTPLLEIAGLGEDLSAGLHAGVAELSGQTSVDTVRFHMVSGVFGDGLRLRLQKKLRYEMKSGDLAIDQATLDISGVPVDVKGTIAGLNSPEPRSDLVFKGGPGQLKDIVGLVPSQLFPRVKGIESSGTLSLEGMVRGSAKNPDFRASLALDNGRLQTSSLPQPVEGIVLHVRADPDSIVVEQFAARSAGSSLRAHATLTSYRQVPHFLLGAEADVDLASISGFYASKSDLHLGGRASAAFIAEGRTDQPAALRVEGTARLTGVGVSGATLAVPVQDLNSDILFSNQDVTLRSASVRMGESDFAASGSLRNLGALQAKGASPSRALVDMQVRSRRINFDQLFPVPSRGKLSLPPLPPLDGAFAFRADRLRSRGIEMTGVAGRITLDHGVARFENVGLGVFGGQVGMNGSLDMNNRAAPRYDLSADARELSVRDLFSQARTLDRYSHLGGRLDGHLTSRLGLKGTLTDSLLPDPRDLTSDGDLEILQAQLSGYPLQKAVADFLSAPQLQTLQISNWKEGFHIEQGKIDVQGLSLKAGPVEVVANGWQSIDGQTQMSFDVLLPPALAAGMRSKLPAQVAAIVFAGGDRIFVPLLLRGRVQSPEVSVDTGRLTTAARQAAEAKLQEQKTILEQQAKQEAGKILQGVIPGADSSRTGSARQQIEKEVKDRLGRLFGK